MGFVSSIVEDITKQRVGSKSLELEIQQSPGHGGGMPVILPLGRQMQENHLKFKAT